MLTMAHYRFDLFANQVANYPKGSQPNGMAKMVRRVVHNASTNDHLQIAATDSNGLASAKPIPMTPRHTRQWLTSVISEPPSW